MLRAAAATGADAHDRNGDQAMSSTPMIRADAFGLLPSVLIALMLVLAALGVVAHAAAL